MKEIWQAVKSYFRRLDKVLLLLSAAAAAFRPGSSSAKTLTHLASSSTINQSDGMQYGDGKST